MKIALWIAQIFLAAVLIWTAYTKLLTPAADLAAMWPWTAEYPFLNKMTGVLDLLAGIGLIFPVLLNIQPKLTVYAAYGTIALMIAGIAFHVSRGEAPVTGFNAFVIAVAGFIAWGRSKTAS